MAVPTDKNVINLCLFLRSKNFCSLVLKLYKITLHPETKTIIDSVTYWTKLGFILRVKYGRNLTPVISFADVYKLILIYNINAL